MKTIFLSMPLKGKTEEEIKTAKAEALKDIHKIMANTPFVVMTGENKIIGNLKGDIPTSLRVFCLGDSIKILSQCDFAYFAKGWSTAKGCAIEHDVALTYEIPILND